MYKMKFLILDKLRHVMQICRLSDYFYLQVAKVNATGDRHSKMELELVTPKWPEKKQPFRIDTRETQCDPDPPPCCCCKSKSSRTKKHKI